MASVRACVPRVGVRSSTPAAPKGVHDSAPDPAAPRRFGFTKQQRLLTSNDFRRVLQARCAQRGPFFTVYIANNTLGYPRLGVSISRKVARAAVRRNAIRRQVRESFRHAQHRLSAQDLFVVANPRAVRESNLSLRRSLERHWQDVIKLCAS